MSALSNYAFKKCLASQALTGLIANTFLFLSRVPTLLLNPRPKPTDLSVCHLAFVHIVMLLTMASLMLTDVFGIQILQNDFTCKALVFLNRVMRYLSICTTCLLSTLQAITISPITSWLAKFKFISTNHIFYSLFFLWFLNLSLCSNLIVHTVSSSNVSWLSHMAITKYCSISPMNINFKELFIMLSLYRDVFFVGLMLLSSAYMVILLIKHHRRAQHLHSTRSSSKASPEQRATHTILLLVSFFVVIYWVDLIISSSSFLLWTNIPVIQDVQSLVMNSYTTVSSLVLIHTDKRITKFCKAYWRRTFTFQNIRICIKWSMLISPK